MLRITIDLWPGGDASRAKRLGTMNLWNDGKHPLHPERGDYRAQVFRKGVTATDAALPLRLGEVNDFPRKRKTAWHLLSQMLGDMGYR